MRPKEVAERLGVSAPTLRLWSTHFEEHLSSGARASLTPKGTAAQRTYAEDDVRVFLRAKALLNNGKTYDEVKELLHGPDEALPIAPEVVLVSAPSSANTASDVAIVSAYETTIRAMREALSSREETIEAKDAVIRQQEALIAALHRREAAASPLPVLTFRQRLEWLVRGRMIEVERSEADVPARPAPGVPAD